MSEARTDIRRLRMMLDAPTAIDVTEDQINTALKGLGLYKARLAGRNSRFTYRDHPNKVYFLSDPDRRRYKIGITSKLFQRKNQIRAMYGIKRDLRLAAAAWGTYEHEAAIHKRFGHLRMCCPITGRPEEWFRTSPELVKFMCDLIVDDVAWVPEEL